MRDHLMQQAQVLATRMPWLGVAPDLAALSLADLCGACRYLQRLADA